MRVLFLIFLSVSMGNFLIRMIAPGRAQKQKDQPYNELRKNTRKINYMCALGSVISVWSYINPREKVDLQSSYAFLCCRL